MEKRLVLLVVSALVIGFGSVLVADKKSGPVVNLSVIEGKPEQFVLYPTSVTTDKSVSWNKSKSSQGDEPTLEFTDGTPKSLSVELMFDGFETRDNVREKYVVPLENLTLVDQSLERPRMVKVVWDGNGLPEFKGVVESVSTKYTMFLPDGTPVRCTTNITMKAASGAKKAEDKPCP